MALVRSSQPDAVPPEPAFKDEVGPTWDLAMAQVTNNDQEINRAISRIDQNFTYLFTVTAAFIAAQLALKSVFKTFDHAPADYLAVALLGLWFPANHTVHSIDLVTAGLWRRQVLFPAVSKLARATAQRTQDIAIRDAATVVNALDWETFRQEQLFEASHTFGMMNILWFLKGLLLYLPTILATGKYAAVEARASARGPTWLEIVLLCALGVAAAVVVLANLRQGNLPAIYREVKRKALPAVEARTGEARIEV